MTLLTTQQKAPSFSALNQQQVLLSSADFLGKQTVVLYFYPKDDTPGCTIEANEFTGFVDEFTNLNTVIIGVSKDDCASHQAFIDKYALNIQLLADTDGVICEDYGVWQEVEKDGVKKWKIVRSTFIIDPEGLLLSVEYNVNPQGHAEAVLALIKNTIQ